MEALWNLLIRFWPITLPLGLFLFIALINAFWTAWVRMNGHPWQWLRARLGWGKNVKELARRLGISKEELHAIEPTYREVLVPKKRDGKRHLLVPDLALKDLQRRILKRLLRRLRAHPAACGFEKGKSVVDNARPHVGQAVVIKMDLVDFFPSVSSKRVEQYFRRIGWNREAALLLTRLCTHEGGLPQGAPTSPRLSNLLHFALDARLARRIERHKGAYTRYADDITLSLPRDHPRRVRGLIQYTRRLAQIQGLKIHLRGKLHILRRHQQQRVTGLVVNEKVGLPRALRRRLRAIEHRLRTRGEATLTPAQLQGWKSYQRMIEQGGSKMRKGPPT